MLSQDLFIQYSPDCIYIKVVTFKKSNYSVLLEARLHFSEFLSNMSNGQDHRYTLQQNQWFKL